MRPVLGRLVSRSVHQFSHLSAPTVQVGRTFATQTPSINMTDVVNLKVRPDRLMSALHESCSFGSGERWGQAATETGMSRLALSDSDRDVRDWFVNKARKLKCITHVDEMGNIFAIRPGRSEGPATFIGSHLDTQPTGGRYDGILGVLSGVEMLEVLDENNVQTEYPVGVVNWTNEEGARFPTMMVSSGVWAGSIPLSTAHNLQEVGTGTATMKSELERIGYLGQVPASHKSMPMAAHFELHIEQGPILEANQQKLGIVTGVQAYRWFNVDIYGKGSHTGTTPFSERADALLLASRFILHSHRVAHRLNALASTGIVEASPGSFNTFAGHVRLSLDIRSPSDAVLDELEKTLKDDLDALAAGENVGGLLEGSSPPKPMTAAWEPLICSPAAIFHQDCIDILRESAMAVTRDDSLFRDMTSGAGHDSVNSNKHCPTAMLFVPSRDGVSHNPVEYTSPEDCATGTQVLMQAVLRYDQLRKTRGS